MSGFDSEADRRDATRREIVALSVGLVRECISQHTITKTIEEQRYLEMTVAAKLIDSQCREAYSQVLRQEIAAAEEKPE